MHKPPWPPADRVPFGIAHAGLRFPAGVVTNCGRLPTGPRGTNRHRTLLRLSNCLKRACDSPFSANETHLRAPPPESSRTEKRKEQSFREPARVSSTARASKRGDYGAAATSLSVLPTPAKRAFIKKVPDTAQIEPRQTEAAPGIEIRCFETSLCPISSSTR